jgi:large subunit ribosomal protein L25
MQFTAEIRETFGSLKAKVLRKNAFIPGTIYKNNGDIVHFSIEEKVISKAVENYKFLNTCVDFFLNGKAMKVLPKSIDFHPITEKPLHVEFKEIPQKGNVQVLVPIVVENRTKSIGIKAGGKLNVPQHNILVSCSPSSIPEKIVIDIEKFGIGRTVFTRHLQADSAYSFPKDVFVLSILGRGRKDKGEEGSSSEN